MPYILSRSSDEIIDADNIRTLSQQTIAEMRAQETGSTCDQYAALDVHLLYVPICARSKAVPPSSMRLPRCGANDNIPMLKSSRNNFLINSLIEGVEEGPNLFQITGCGTGEVH
jgi:hypothetical protein